MRTIDSIIIEDDSDHIAILKHYLSKFCDEINIIGTAGTVSSALKVLTEFKPEIIFLDMELEGESSFKILEVLGNMVETEIIILSSHSKYALRAFEHLATDYVLKPLKPEKLMLAVKKAKNNINLRTLASQKKMEYQINRPITQLVIPFVESVEIIQINEVLYLEADGRYTVFHLKKNKTLVASKNLGEYEKLLINNNFFRIHNCFIVNMDHAVKINKKDGSYLRLSSQKCLPISKRRTSPLYHYLNLK